MKQIIKKNLNKIISFLQKEKIFPQFKIPKIKIEYQEERNHGDYSSNIAMVLSKIFKRNPQEIAKSIKENLELKIKNQKLFEKIEIAKPGFINFFLSKESLQKQVLKILKEGENFGKIKIERNKKINIEFCSANPTGPLHLGHGRVAFWGNTLANVLTRAGYKVSREYFINDYGRQILLLGKSIDVRFKEILGKKIKMSPELYQGDYIKEIAKEIIQKNKKKYLKLPEEERIKIFTEFGLKKILRETKELLTKIGIKYDIWFSEKKLFQRNLIKKTIQILKKKGMIYEKEKAIWFFSTKFGDDKDRVLIKADGEPTYFASDIAYHFDKNSRGYDLMINIFGADHWGYKTRLMAAVKTLGFEEKLKIIIGQFVRLIKKGQEIKMSKRGGTFITLEELINEIGLDATKFFFLNKTIDTHIDFDLDLAKETSEKNPVYYFQYGYARIESIFKKSKLKEQEIRFKAKLRDLRYLIHSSERELIKQLIRFPEIIEEVVYDYQVQRIPQYALGLITNFHRFYQDCQVISKDQNLTKARLALILATKLVIKNTAFLMDISTPKKM